MTAREAIEAIVDRTIEDQKYSPVDVVKAIGLLDEMEQRDLQNPAENDDAVLRLIDALNRSIPE